MTSSLLDTLLIAVNDARAPATRAEASVKLGVCLAQLGRCDEAGEILGRLRTEYPSGSIPRATIRLMMLEGILSYYQSFQDSADRLRRAFAISNAAGIPDLAAEAQVWLAHFAFNFERYREFERSLGGAFDNFSLLDDSHRARVCLLVADGLQYLGDRANAGEWYSLARIFSRRVHDHAVMVAIEYNRLSIGLSRIRADWAIASMENPAGGRNWLLEFESVRALHIGFRAHALAELLELCDAYAHEARGEFAAARQALTRIRSSGGLERTGVSDELLEIELEWCTAMAAAPAQFDCSSMFGLDQIDSLSENERLMALFFFRSIADRHGLIVDGQRLSAMQQASFESFRASCAELAAALCLVRDHLPQIKSQALS